ncbi:hypothetical protein, conserved [Babesia bigemina]|uniref:Uncharacterized protein n=1 Tax=Babesia bigemina TaxID=5866 RepID=A0A061CZK3_BABBI|nr:hypothetical protein, conserved [Babesia bigemina]CDR93818.1 hypothetical protein, conserved [Babesia bigemina]|eukprot:XP_012766004.1 hypothetical protein, conserved [Babesia bigemina]
MASRRGGNVTATTKTIYYHSAIGTHRLHPRPLKNILYPYYWQYKPVYRARNPRTPQYYWPSIDKYPWHSHQKRFPKPEDITISIFSDFARREPQIRTLFETLHPLPLHGVNCLLWKTDRRSANENYRNVHNDGHSDSSCSSTDTGRVVSVNGKFYVTDMVTRNNLCYMVKHVQFKLRPFKARVLADLYAVGEANGGRCDVATATLLRQNVSPVGSVRGEWRWSPPYKTGKGADGDAADVERLSVENPYLYIYGLKEYAATTT